MSSVKFKNILEQAQRRLDADQASNQELCDAYSVKEPLPEAWFAPRAYETADELETGARRGTNAFFHIDVQERRPNSLKAQSYSPMKKTPRVRPMIPTEASRDLRDFLTTLFSFSEELNFPYLPLGASIGEIKTFFRQAALQIHPDHYANDADKAKIQTAKFLELKRATDYLISVSQIENAKTPRVTAA